MRPLPTVRLLLLWEAVDGYEGISDDELLRRLSERLG
jgi:hypothetical protein